MELPLPKRVVIGMSAFFERVLVGVDSRIGRTVLRYQKVVHDTLWSARH